MNTFLSKRMAAAAIIGFSSLSVPLVAQADTLSWAENTVSATSEIFTPSYHWTYNPNIEPGSYDGPHVELKGSDGKVISTVPVYFANRINYMPNKQAFLFLPDRRIVKGIVGDQWDNRNHGYEIIDSHTAPYGTDIFNKALVPWKSVTMSTFPIGSKVYVSEFDGIVLPNGSVHNGEFVVSTQSHTPGKLEIFTGDADQYDQMASTLSAITKVAVDVPVNLIRHRVDIYPVPGGGFTPYYRFDFAEGETATFTARPWHNFVLDRVTVNDVLVTPDGNSVTFSNISRSHDLKATFKPILLTDYKITQDWGHGFNAEVTVTNNTNKPVTGWSLEWKFYGDQKITNIWNGSHKQEGNSVTVSNVEWNDTIAPGSVQYSS